jgi:hypothetical protein
MPYIALDPTAAAPAPPTTIGDPLIDGPKVLQDFVMELDSLLSGRDDVTPERLAQWVNMAYVDLATSLRIDELKASMVVSTVEDGYLYALPDAVFSLLGAATADEDSIRGGYPLEKIDLDEFRRRSGEAGRLEAYFRYGSLLVVWPRPLAVGAVAIDFRVRPAYMTDLEHHSPILRQEWYEAILLNAKRIAFSSLKEQENAMIANNELIASIRKRLDRSALEHEGMVTRSSSPRHPMELTRGRRPRRLF